MPTLQFYKKENGSTTLELDEGTRVSCACSGTSSATLTPASDPIISSHIKQPE